MAVSVSLYHQTQKKTKFLRRFDVEGLTEDAKVIDLKKEVCQWMMKNTNVKFPEPYELSVKMDDNPLTDTSKFGRDNHIKVVYTSWQTMLSNDAAAQSAETAFREAMSSLSVPSASSQPASSSDVPANPPVVEQSPSDGFQALVHHMKHCEKTKGYNITFIQGEPHISTAHGMYMPWKSIGDDPTEFLDFIKRFNVVITNDHEDLAQYDDIHALAMFLDGFDEGRALKLCEEVEKENVIDDQVVGHERSLVVLSLMSHKQREELKVIASETISSSSDTSDDAIPEDEVNPFRPFQGKAMRLGGEPEPESEDDEAVYEYDGEMVVRINKKNQSSVGVAKIIMETTKGTVEFYYNYPKTATIKTMLTNLNEKVGIYVGCHGFEQDEGLNLTYDKSIVSSWETVSSLVSGRTTPFKIAVNLRGGAKSILKSALKDNKNKKTVLSAKSDELIHKMKAKKFECSPLKEAQSIASYLANVDAKNSIGAFENAISRMTKEAVEECIEIMDIANTNRYGSTEAKIEAVGKVILSVLLTKLSNHTEEIEEAKATIFTTLLRHYANFAMKGDRYNKTPLETMLNDKLKSFEPSKKDGDGDDDMKGLCELLDKSQI